MKNNMDLLLENWRKFVNEDLSGLGGEKPIALSQIQGAEAVMATKAGLKDGNTDDDKLSGGPTQVPVASLSPMQKEVLPDKALAFALGFLNKDVLSKHVPLDDMEAIVVNDVETKKNYIMDGHHRWAARTLIDPNAKVNVQMVKNATAGQVVTALNLWTKAKGRSGNSGKGDVTQFASSIPAEIDKALSQGVKLFPKQTPEQVKIALGKMPGANGDAEKGKQLMIANAAKLPTQKHPDAPDRVNMPVVDGAAEVEQAVKDLISGKIDFKKPISPETQKRASAYMQQRKSGATASNALKAANSSVQKESLRKIIRQVIKESLGKK